MAPKRPNKCPDLPTLFSYRVHIILYELNNPFYSITPSCLHTSRRNELTRSYINHQPQAFPINSAGAGWKDTCPTIFGKVPFLSDIRSFRGVPPWSCRKIQAIVNMILVWWPAIFSILLYLNILLERKWSIWIDLKVTPFELRYCMKFLFERSIVYINHYKFTA